MGSLRINQIQKSYNGHTVLHPIDLTVKDGQFCCMLGSSGSGKSTLLRIIAGLEEPDLGSVHVGERDVTPLAVEKRRIGFVFQNYALFPHMTVGANVAYGLRAQGARGRAVRHRCEEMLRLVGLAGFEGRKPAQLSGGQQQRVALARVLVTEPEILLLDEPLSALDRKIRGEMQRELKRIHHETGLTTVMVTHDQEEAMNLGDEVLMLDSGHIQQHGAPLDIYRKPTNSFVAGFLGAEPLGDGVIVEDAGRLAVLIGNVRFEVADAPPIGSKAAAVVMAESVSVKSLDQGGEGHRGRIRSVDFYGPFARIQVDVGGITLPSVMLSHTVHDSFVVDSEVMVAIARGGLHAFAA